MSYRDVLSATTVAVSVSESPDLGTLGLSRAHLDEVMTEIARHLLALGARLSYGGDLRPEGFSATLFELVARYRRDADLEDERTGISNYLAWPVHASMDWEELLRFRQGLVGIADLVCLTLEGRVESWDRPRSEPAITPSRAEWSQGLTSMRQTTSELSDARIVVGGKVSDYQGSMPGVIEETLTSMSLGKPVFILGGFGGAARDLAEAFGLVERWAGSRPQGSFPFLENQPRIDPQLRNGLNGEENSRLAETPFIEEAITLILKGLAHRAN